MDVIKYTEDNDLPAAVLSLDIEKALDSVRHDFLIKVLKCFNLVIIFFDGFRHFTPAGRVLE